MKTLDGVHLSLNDGYGLCHVSNFTDDLKDALRRNLTKICHGENNALGGLSLYHYKPTILAFLDRYRTKPLNTQKGMIGEFLSHIVINELFDKFETASPFFNLEEKSIKKGFDLLLYSKLDQCLWITEVKSGEIHQNKDENETTVELIDTAYRDLKARLNENEQTYWLNALNAANIAISNSKDYKNAILRLLDSEGSSTIKNEATSKDNCVFLISTLFHDINSKINIKTVQEAHIKITNKQEFKKVFVFSVQKNTLNKVVEFLEQESNA